MNLRQLVELSDRPFASHPQVARYFPAASIEDARRRLVRSIERGDGPGVVIGSAGSGKSLLLQVIAAQYRDKFDVVLLACAQLCTRRALLQAIHFELGLDYRRRDEGELRLSLLDQLLSSDDATQGLLLLVDETQALAVHLLEELRLLTNLARGGTSRVRLVMAGLPSLEEKLASPELQSFSQRLAARCYLAALTRAETAQFVRAQMAASGADADRLMEPAAFDALFAATDGVPRLVNQVCDRALVLADARRQERIDAAAIQAAWADLQQLPTPWETPKEIAQHAQNLASVVEFGSLDEKSLSPKPPAVITSRTFGDRPASEDPTELDEVAPTVAAATPPAQLPVRRARVLRDRIPEAVDPFAEPFEEEELVLDSFATLASIFLPRTPRVENRREPAFSRLVQNALDAALAADAKNGSTPDAIFQEPLVNERHATRPAIRLAIVADSPPASLDTRERPNREMAAAIADVDARFADDFVKPRRRQQPATVVSPLRGPNSIEPAPSLHCDDDSADSILIIEDEPAGIESAQSGVRRENYRQLFSRLRHGT